MAYSPPRGVPPPQLEGKRTGRPKGSRDHAAAWADVQWGYAHRAEDKVVSPTLAALLWWRFAYMFPDEVGHFLARYERL